MRNYLQEPGRYQPRQPSVRRQRQAVLTLIAIFAIILILVLIISAVRRRNSEDTGSGHYSVISVNAPMTVEPVLSAAPAPVPTLEATQMPTQAPTDTPEPTPTPTPAPDLTTTLRPGDTGDAVAQMQTRLIELGYLDGEADGKYGKDTQKAVKAFQKKNKLTTDGVAGNKTLTALYREDAISNR